MRPVSRRFDPCFRDQHFAGLAKWEGNGSWPRHEAVRSRQSVRACSSSVERRIPNPRQRGFNSFLARHHHSGRSRCGVRGPLRYPHNSQLLLDGTRRVHWWCLSRSARYASSSLRGKDRTSPDMPIVRQRSEMQALLWFACAREHEAVAAVKILASTSAG